MTSQRETDRKKKIRYGQGFQNTKWPAVLHVLSNRKSKIQLILTILIDLKKSNDPEMLHKFQV